MRIWHTLVVGWECRRYSVNFTVPYFRVLGSAFDLTAVFLFVACIITVLSVTNVRCGVAPNCFVAVVTLDSRSRVLVNIPGP